LPRIAWSISSSVGELFAESSVVADIIWPD
jgi:hypothetical protein